MKKTVIILALLLSLILLGIRANFFLPSNKQIHDDLDDGKVLEKYLLAKKESLGFFPASADSYFDNYPKWKYAHRSRDAYTLSCEYPSRKSALVLNVGEEYFGSARVGWFFSARGIGIVPLAEYLNRK